MMLKLAVHRVTDVSKGQNVSCSYLSLSDSCGLCCLGEGLNNPISC